MWGGGGHIGWGLPVIGANSVMNKFGSDGSLPWASIGCCHRETCIKQTLKAHLVFLLNHESPCSSSKKWETEASMGQRKDCHLSSRKRREIFYGESSEQVAHRKTGKLWSIQIFKLAASLLDGSSSPWGTQPPTDESSPYAKVIPTTRRTKSGLFQQTFIQGRHTQQSQAGFPVILQSSLGAGPLTSTL